MLSHHRLNPNDPRMEEPRGRVEKILINIILKGLLVLKMIKINRFIFIILFVYELLVLIFFHLLKMEEKSKKQTNTSHSWSSPLA